MEEQKEAPHSRQQSLTQRKSMSRLKSTQFVRDRSMSRLKLRRASYGFSSVSGIGQVRSHSQVALEFRRPILLYLPTYQLDPSRPFHLPTVLKVINEQLDEQFTGHKYNVQQSPALALKLATDVLKRLKELEFERYRLLCVVCVGQRRSQSYNNAISVLWDHERDNYANVQRERTSCFVQITVFGVYLD